MGASTFSAKTENLPALRDRVDHEADEGLADEDVALLFGLGLHELADLAGELRVVGGHERVVLIGDEDGVEGRGGVHAIDDQRLVLHLVRGLLGELLEGEGGVRGAEDAGDAVFKYGQEVHE